jgi:large subunit ribosomal protein L25
MADRVKIQAAPRTILGKQVRQLRRQGRLPANVYGRALDSVSIDIDAREFTRNTKAGGLRGMFELAIEGEKASRYVVIRGIERKGGMGEPIHVDFYQVDPNKPIHASVPLRVVGVAPAVRDLAGTLVQSLEIVQVRCLPLNIPEAIEADAGLLTGFDTQITVADVKASAGIEILSDPALVIAVVNPPRLRATAV